jgi:hypothetical protein
MNSKRPVSRCLRRLALALAATAPLAGPAAAQPAIEPPAPEGYMTARAFGVDCDKSFKNCNPYARLFYNLRDSSVMLRVEVADPKNMKAGWTVCELRPRGAISYPQDGTQDPRAINPEEMRELLRSMNHSSDPAGTPAFLKDIRDETLALNNAGQSCLGRLSL